MSDDRVRAVTIGEVTPYATKVVVVDYGPAWPARFAATASTT